MSDMKLAGHVLRVMDKLATHADNRAKLIKDGLCRGSLSSVLLLLSLLLSLLLIYFLFV